jgi:MinD-like ATPase involved in chromosome partitioning or flagellar assembly
MAQTLSEGKKVYRQIADVAARFLSTPVYEAGVLCKDDNLVQAVRRREPVVMAFPKADISSALKVISNRLTNGARSRTDQRGFFKKVVNWLF